MASHFVARGGQVGTRQSSQSCCALGANGKAGARGRWTPPGRSGSTSDSIASQSAPGRRLSSFSQRRSANSSGFALCAGLHNNLPGEDENDAFEREEVCRIPEEWTTDSFVAEDELEIWLVGDSDFEFDEEGYVEAESYATAWWEELDACYVISFQGPDSETAGFYANRADNGNGPIDIILVFEDHEDACRHCGLLQANIVDAEFPEAFVEAIAPSTLLRICEDKGCHCSVQRRGSLLMPPEQIVIEEDIEVTRARLERLLKGI